MATNKEVEAVLGRVAKATSKKLTVYGGDGGFYIGEIVNEGGGREGGIPFP